jgi:hypothetical protein
VFEGVGGEAALRLQMMQVTLQPVLWISRHDATCVA